MGDGDIHDSDEVETTTPQRDIVFSPDGNLDNGHQRARSISIASADLETAITKSGCGKFNLALLLLSFPASCTNGFVTGSMSYVVPAAATDLALTPTEKAMLQSACFAGMISSGFLWGFLSDAMGRKKLLVFGFFMDSLMNVLTGAFPVYPLMLFFKYMSGFMICGPFSIFTAYISEVFLSKRRDFAVLLSGLYSAIGQIVLAGLALWIIPSEVPWQIPLKSWQLFHIACAIPSFISGLGCIFCVESPKFLADKGDQEGALKVIRSIYTINTGNLSTSYPIKRLKNQSRKINKNKSMFGLFLEGVAIFRPPFIQKAAIIFLVHMGAAASQNTIRLWLPEMLTLVKSSELNPKLGLCPLLLEGNKARANSTVVKPSNAPSEVYTDMMFVNLGCVVGHVLFLMVVKYIGKKKMLWWCALVGGVCSVVIPLIAANYVFIPASIFLAFYNIVIFCNINIVVEVFPTRIRATSVSILMLIARIGVLMVNFLIANLIYSFCQYFFYGLALASLVIGALVIFVPEKPIDDRPVIPISQFQSDSRPDQETTDLPIKNLTK